MGSGLQLCIVMALAGVESGFSKRGEGGMTSAGSLVPWRDAGKGGEM